MNTLAHAAQDAPGKKPSGNLGANQVLMLGGFRVCSTSAARLEARLSRALAADQQKLLLFANTNFVVQCQALKKQLAGDDTIIINDGIGMDIAARLIHGRRFPENLNGTDFIPRFLQHQRDRVRVFLLGGKPGIAERAAERLAMDYGVSVVGTSHGYVAHEQMLDLLETINTSGANVLLVAMGNPLQEQWLVRHLKLLNPCLLMGVGACLDFLAGDKARAPRLLRQLHLEWLYRLCLEPRRLLRRYTLDIAIFLRLCIKLRALNHD